MTHHSRTPRAPQDATDAASVRFQVAVPPTLHSVMQRDARELCVPLSTLGRLIFMDYYRRQRPQVDPKE